MLDQRPDLGILPQFRYGERVLDLVEEYTYLGIKFNWNGKFEKAKKELFMRGTKAMFAVITKGRRLGLDVETLLKLFDVCVLPILTYGAEVWGYESIELLEKVHTKFCKIILKVSKYTHNTQIYGDLGRFPINIEVKKRMVNYWSRLLLGKKSKISWNIYSLLYMCSIESVYDPLWINSIRTTLQNCGMNFVWLSQNVQTLHSVGKSVQNILQDQYIQRWRSRLEEDDTFLSYRIYKHVFERESYINTLPDYLMHSVAEFRAGSRLLAVNNSKLYDRPRNERICKYCDSNSLGDEFHFLFECKILHDIRNRIIPRFYIRHPSCLKFSNLLNANNRLLHKVAYYIFAGFKILRTSKISQS